MIKTLDECINYLDKQVKNNQNIVQTSYFISIKNHLESLKEFTDFGNNNRWNMIKNILKKKLSH